MAAPPQMGLSQTMTSGSPPQVALHAEAGALPAAVGDRNGQIPMVSHAFSHFKSKTHQ